MEGCVPPTVTIVQVSTEQARGIVPSHTHSGPASQQMCHACHPCMRTAMSHESRYCVSIAPSLYLGQGQQPSSLVQPSHPDIFPMARRAWLPRAPAPQPPLGLCRSQPGCGRGCAPETSPTRRILGQHQTNPTATLRSSVCPLTPQGLAGPRSSSCLREQLTWEFLVNQT